MSNEFQTDPRQIAREIWYQDVEFPELLEEAGKKKIQGYIYDLVNPLDIFARQGEHSTRILKIERFAKAWEILDNLDPK